MLLYRHLLQSLQTSPAAHSSFPKARVAWEGTAAEPITGLGFQLAGQSESDKPQHPPATQVEKQENGAKTDTVGLFIVTTNRTCVLPVISGKGSEPRSLEDFGAPLNCSIMDCSNRYLMIARDDGIYTYGTESRRACYAYEGQYLCNISAIAKTLKDLVLGAKASIRAHGGSVVMVSPPFVPAATSYSATIRRSAASGPINSIPTAAKVTVFDLDNKFISYSSVLAAGVKEVFGNHGQALYILDGEETVSSFDLDYLLGLRLSCHPSDTEIDGSIYRREAGSAPPQIFVPVGDIYGENIPPRGLYDGRHTSALWRSPLREG